MRKAILLSLLFTSIAFVSAYGQGLPITPSDSVSVSDTAGAFSTVSAFIYLINNRADSVKVLWRVVSDTAASGWDLELCDNYQCYSLPVTPKTSLPFGPGDTLNLHALFAANCTTGTGNMHISVQVVGDNTVTELTYQAILTSTCGTSGINTINLPTAVNVFPNPASDRITCSGLEPGHNLLIQVLDLQGRILNSDNETFDGTAELNVQDLPAGLYFVKLTDLNINLVTVGKFIKL